MTAKELREKLAELPDDTDILQRCEGDELYELCRVEPVFVTRIKCPGYFDYSERTDFDGAPGTEIIKAVII